MLQSGDRFFLIGLSFKKANLATREAFSLSNEAMEALLEDYRNHFNTGAFAVSTCNRTELYGFAPQADDLLNLLLTYSKGSAESFAEYGYIKEGDEAISHLFRVGSGLESQIIGDFQIISQVKQGFELAKKMNCGNAMLERLINQVIKSSKRIKNETGLSSGTTSLAYAAVQAIQHNWEQDHVAPNILLYGVGKIGRATCDNLYRKFPQAKITLINRTMTKAEELALKYPVETAPIERLSEVAKASDVVVVATGADKPTLLKEHFEGKVNGKLLIDLSVPRNIDLRLQEEENTLVIDVNGLAEVMNSGLEKRKTEIPKAEKIAAEEEADFKKWMQNRKFAPMLNAIKENLQEIKLREMRRLKEDIHEDAKGQLDLLTDRIILKITRQVALHLTSQDDNPEDSLRTIESIFRLSEERRAT